MTRIVKVGLPADVTNKYHIEWHRSAGDILINDCSIQFRVVFTVDTVYSGDGGRLRVPEFQNMDQKQCEGSKSRNLRSDGHR
jgi:hypothetical protein